MVGSGVVIWTVHRAMGLLFITSRGGAKMHTHVRIGKQYVPGTYPITLKKSEVWESSSSQLVVVPIVVVGWMMSRRDVVLCARD